MFKKIILPIISFIVFALIAVFSLYEVSIAFVPMWTEEGDNHITQIVKGYYAEKDNSLDVLFMGNSDMYRAISPINLWDEYGMASYAYTSPGQRGWTTYYVLLDALRSQTPKLIVLNVDGFQSTNHSNESCTRKALDNMELSSVKLKAINDEAYGFTDEALGFTNLEKLGLIFPIFRYHSNVSEINIDTLKVSYGNNIFAEKGQDMIAKTDGYMGGKSYMEDIGETYEFPESTKIYMDLVVQECKDRGIELLLVEMPTSDSWSYAKGKAFEEYAKDKDVPFLDLNTKLDEMEFDWTSNTPDQGDHLNIYGADVATEYLGKYLKEHYDIPDHSNDPEYKDSWNEASRLHKQNKEKLINESNN